MQCVTAGPTRSKLVVRHPSTSPLFSVSTLARRGSPWRNPQIAPSASSIREPSRPTTTCITSSWSGTQRSTNVLEVLEANINAPSCRHILIKGDRGQGKTMLLARVAVDLRTDSRFNRHLLPIRFMEENHEIVTFGDFWLEALFYLARAVPHGASELLEERSRLAEDWRAPGVRGPCPSGRRQRRREA